MRDIVETCDVTRNEAGGPQENLNATEGNDDLTIVTTENGLGTTLFALGGDDTITDYSSGGSNIYGGEGNDVIVQSAAGWNGSLLSGRSVFNVSAFGTDLTAQNFKAAIFKKLSNLKGHYS